MEPEQQDPTTTTTTTTTTTPEKQTISHDETDEEVNSPDCQTGTGTGTNPTPNVLELMTLTLKSAQLMEQQRPSLFLRHPPSSLSLTPSPSLTSTSPFLLRTPGTKTQESSSENSTSRMPSSSSVTKEQMVSKPSSDAVLENSWDLTHSAVAQCLPGSNNTDDLLDAVCYGPGVSDSRIEKGASTSEKSTSTRNSGKNSSNNNSKTNNNSSNRNNNSTNILKPNRTKKIVQPKVTVEFYDEDTGFKIRTKADAIKEECNSSDSKTYHQTTKFKGSGTAQNSKRGEDEGENDNGDENSPNAANSRRQKEEEEEEANDPWNYVKTCRYIRGPYESRDSCVPEDFVRFVFGEKEGEEEEEEEDVCEI